MIRQHNAAMSSTIQKEKKIFLSMFARRMDTQINNYPKFGLKTRLHVFEPSG